MEDMTVLSEELLRKMPFIFQKCLLENPRAKPAEFGRRAGISRATAKRYLDQFMDEKKLFCPQLRLKCSNDIAEYMYLLKVDNPQSFIPILKKEKSVFYYCVLIGDFNLSFMSYHPVDLSCYKGYTRTIESGIRGKYSIPSVANRSYSDAFTRINEMCEGRIEPSMVDNTLKDIAWTEELWNLFTELKYDVSIDFTPLVKKYEFKYTTFRYRVKWLLQNTDLFVPLYPLGEHSYTYFYFLFKSDYQNLIINSFYQLPVFSTHLRIKDSLLSLIPIPYGMEGDHFQNIFSLWERKGLFDSYTMSIPYMSKGFTHPGIPFPPFAPPPHGVTKLGNGKTGIEKLHTSFI
ncbi:MAG: hypothetical protein WBA22_09260 [Candidatus Methanofastidiosia archaeon]